MDSSSSTVQFYGLFDNSIYFKEESEFDGDNFQLEREATYHLSHSTQNRFLVLTPANQFEFLHLTRAELELSESKFNIRLYNNKSTDMQRMGRAVMLYVDTDGKKMVACCWSKDEIRPEEMVPPEKINEDQHKALFYLTSMSSSRHQCMFESSLHQNMFLALKLENGVFKLVLQEKVDEVDESRFMIMS